VVDAEFPRVLLIVPVNFPPRTPASAYPVAVANRRIVIPIVRNILRNIIRLPVPAIWESVADLGK